MIKSITIVPTIVGSLSGVVTRSTEPLYAAIPAPLKGKGDIVYYPEISVVICRGVLESTLVLKCFVSTEVEELKQLVSNYFKEDNPNDLMNWLI